jgi:hypothetical protein
MQEDIENEVRISTLYSFVESYFVLFHGEKKRDLLPCSWLMVKEFSGKTPTAFVVGCTGDFFE